MLRRASALARPEYSPEFSTNAVVGERRLRIRRRAAPSTGRITGRIGNPVRLAEFEIALVVRGHRHDRARAVVHQHEVADPDRNFLAAVRIHRVVPGEAPSFSMSPGPFCARASIICLARARPASSSSCCGKRMFRRQDHASRAVDGIDARGEDANLLAAVGASVKSISDPSERPIQLRCIESTRSGQPPSSFSSVSRSNSSA